MIGARRAGGNTKSRWYREPMGRAPREEIAPATGGQRRYPLPHRIAAGAAIVAVALLASGCGMFDTEYEPVQKGQQVGADVSGLARVDESGRNIPLRTARPGVTTDARPVGTSGQSGTTGSSPSTASGSSGGDGKTGDGDNAGDPGETTSGGSSTAPSTTAPDPVIATVPHTAPAVPNPIPGSTTSTTAATRDFEAFCLASSGLIRLSRIFLDDGVNADLAYMSAQAKAAGQYILNMADTYPLPDRSAFDELIPAANQFIAAFAGFTSVEQVRYAIGQFKLAHSAALDQIGDQQAKYCPETLNL